MKKGLLVCAAIMLAGCSEEKSTGDPRIDQALKEAVELDSLQERNGLYYQVHTGIRWWLLRPEAEPFSGWAKEMYASGQVWWLDQFKDGKWSGPQTVWHENGQKQAERTWKDGKPVSAKYWNKQGEEVETIEESRK